MENINHRTKEGQTPTAVVVTITTQPLLRLFFITGSHSSNQTAVYQINHHGDSTPKRHYNLLLENLSKVTSHDSLTHLNNNALTQPLKLSEILSQIRNSIHAKDFFDLVFSISLKTKFRTKTKKPSSQTYFAPRCWCHVLHCP